MAGLVMVLIGVWGGFRSRRKKYRYVCDPNDLMPIEFRQEEWEIRRKKREDAWEYVLVFGLALELIALPRHISSAASLNKQAEESRSTNLVLHAKLFELQAKLNPRVITTDQREKFLNIVTNFPKSPVRVFVSSGSDEADTYASQIRNLLNEAGYGRQGETIVRLEQIRATRTPIYPYPTGAAFAPDPVRITFFGTNIESVVWPGIEFWVERTNNLKITHYSYSPLDVRAVPVMINDALNAIGIPTEIFPTTMLSEVKLGEWAIFVVPKDY